MFDPRDAETRVLFGMAEAEVAQRTQRSAAAVAYRSIDEVLREAAAHPEVFIDEQMLRGDAVDMAVRAAVTDLAIRLGMAEQTVRSQGQIAAALRERMPGLWAWFCDGDVPTANAREAAALVVELPPETWSEFESALMEPARTLAPARFRARARALRERLDPAPAAERHAAAVEQRRVWSEGDRHGMSWFGAYLPSEAVALANAHVDGIALELFRHEDEERTLAQLRADVVVDLLTGAQSSFSPRVSVGLMIPVMTMLGRSSEPPILEGVGPIDLETAKELAATAPSLTRLLTDPVSGRVLQMDPNQYRTTKALRRWFSIRHCTCSTPGCGRRAEQSDLDHITAWADGGATTAANLQPLCRPHHSMKHQTKWRVDQPPGADRARWTSPTGHVSYSDPPPF